MEERSKELQKVFEKVDAGIKSTIWKMIDHAVFLETRLEELKAYPFIEINPKNPAQQRPTAAARQYKELLQQYTNIVKVFCSVVRRDEGGESPLMEMLSRYG